VSLGTLVAVVDISQADLDNAPSWTQESGAARRSVQLRGSAVTRTTTEVLASVAVAALATAALAAVVRYRQEQRPDPHERAHLDELDSRLVEVQEPGMNVPAGGLGRVVERLERSQGISVARLRRWIAGVRHETLTPEQTTAAESDFGALERETAQDGV